MDTAIIVTHLANSGLAGQEQRFEKNQITIGRDAHNDVDFDPDEDLVVSHKHAELYLEHGKLFIKDLESRNGTYVNQRRIHLPTEVLPDDKIHFGAMGPLVTVKLRGLDVIPETIGKTIFDNLLGRQKPQSEAAKPSVAESQRAELSSSGATREPASPTAPAAAPAPLPPAARRRGSAMLFRCAAVLLAVGLFAAGVAAGHLYLPALLDGADDEPSSEQLLPPDHVAALGRLEPDGGVLDIGGTTGLTLKKLLVEEGDLVKLEDKLAYLSTYDTLQAEYKSAQTALDEAKRQLASTMKHAEALVAEANSGVEETEEPLDLELQAAAADIKRLRAHVAVASEDLSKLDELPRDSATDQLSRQRLVEQRALRELEAAEKRLEQLRASTDVQRKRAKAKLTTAIANRQRLEDSISIESAQKTVARAESQVEQAIVRAPRDGTVLRVLTREGATLGGQPILQLGDTRHFYVTAEVYETDVYRVAAGARAKISSPALPDELQGTVEQVLSMVERNSIRDLNPKAPEDLRVVEVKIRLDDEQIQAHRKLLEKLIHLQVDVRIEAGGLKPNE